MEIVICRALVARLLLICLSLVNGQQQHISNSLPGAVG